MKFQTQVEIPEAKQKIQPTDRILFVGSCFAENIGRRFVDNCFRCVVNPYGTMYNPASILHTVERAIDEQLVGRGGVDVAVFTLGTNHVYILKETGEIVDNCQKRPQKLFREEKLSISECCTYIESAMQKLRELNSSTRFILTVSPIRYAKYGYQESLRSKSRLLLAIDELVEKHGEAIFYFPAYEVMNDELRDYRFYSPDMLHPSEQAVDYIYERFDEVLFSPSARQMIEEWRPIKSALAHRPFNPESEEYKSFLEKTRESEAKFRKKWFGEPALT